MAARVPIVIMAADPATGNAVANATATVHNTDTGVLVPLYAAKTGPAGAPNPIVTDANGRGVAWADRASIKITYGGGVAAWDEYRDLRSGSDRGDDALVLPSSVSPPLVTALPANPSDGDRCYLLVDQAGASAGKSVVWTCRYRALNPDGTVNANTLKWDVLEGEALYDELYVDEGYGAGLNGAYGDLATVGPSITTPAGITVDGILEYGAYSYFSNVAANVQAFIAPAVGATAAQDADALVMGFGAALAAGQQGYLEPRVERFKAGIPPASLIRLKYKYTGGGAPVLTGKRRLALRPRRVG